MGLMSFDMLLFPVIKVSIVVVPEPAKRSKIILFLGLSLLYFH